MRELLVALKQKGLQTGLVSNTTVFESVAPENMGVNSLFDATVFSWQVGHLKPSHEIFDAVFEKLGVSEEEVFFVDDNEENVEAAKALGAQGIVFEGVGALEQTMADLGIL